MVVMCLSDHTEGAGLMELWKYALAGFVIPLFWGSVFWLCRRFAPGQLTPVGVAWKRLLRRESAADAAAARSQERARGR